MIKKIVIKDVASYDAEGVVLDDLRKVNFIYGGNGTGKTTISRVLGSVNPEVEFPGCEVEWAGAPILRKAEEDGTRILPLIVAPCEYEDSELGDFQAINSPDRTLADLGNDKAAIDRVYLDLNKEIKSLV